MNPLPNKERAMIEDSKLVSYALNPQSERGRHKARRVQPVEPVKEITKTKRYDTVVLLEAIGGFQKSERGAVVEVYTTPYEAYDIEIVTDEGKTKGLVEAVRLEQVEIVSTTSADVRFASIRIEEDGTFAAVLFSEC